MALPKNILYPVDFSDRCRAVWPAVASMAEHLAASITVLHALDIERIKSKGLREEVQTIRDHLQDQLSTFPPGVQLANIRRELSDGPAAASIVEVAARMEAPLIMMPTRGHTRFRQLLLGSVTAAVLHDAGCPVWTEAHVDSPVPKLAYKSMICAVDMGPQTAHLLRAAKELSERFGACLYIVHSIPRGDPRFASGASLRAHSFLVDTAKEKYAQHCSLAGVDEPFEIAEDEGLIDSIVTAIARHNGDLLIIGRGVIHGALGRLRTNAHSLIRRAPCPVLSI